eukprot:Hpha_TRINITY_DN34108_c0_g1::TRINITY_DN34108_c0_g1_i1::g.75819::m.75819
MNVTQPWELWRRLGKGEGCKRLVLYRRLVGDQRPVPAHVRAMRAELASAFTPFELAAVIRGWYQEGQWEYALGFYAQWCASTDSETRYQRGAVLAACSHGAHWQGALRLVSEGGDARRGG